MIMSDKTQCRSCQYFGTVKSFETWCCRGFDENGIIHCERAAKKSNCWCLDFISNEKPFKMQPFHVIGKYFTERYGSNVKLMPQNAGDDKFSIKNVTEFRIRIESPKLKKPFSAEFSTVGKDGMKSYKDVVEEAIKNER